MSVVHAYEGDGLVDRLVVDDLPEVLGRGELGAVQFGVGPRAALRGVVESPVSARVDVDLGLFAEVEEERNDFLLKMKCLLSLHDDLIVS